MFLDYNNLNLFIALAPEFKTSFKVIYEKIVYAKDILFFIDDKVDDIIEKVLCVHVFYIIYFFLI